jgi:hypothetical protein
MQSRFSTAFRAAVLLSALVAGCNDAPFAPRQRSAAPTAATAGADQVQAFSGAQADSVMNVLEAGWTRNGHAEYRQARLAWRKTNGVPDSVHVPGLEDPIVITLPNAYLYGEETMRPPPQILSHFEALHFGYSDQYTSVPDGVEAEVTFVGDQADITVASGTITRNSGSTYSLSGRIAMGPGQIIGCTDGVFGACDNRRHLNGVLVLPAAPTCDARGNGTVSYYVTNITPPISVSYDPTSFGSAGNGDQSASAAAVVSSSAGPCPSDSGQPKQSPSSDSTSNAPAPPPPGSPAGPPPGYDGPGVPPLPPSYPPSGVGGGTADFWCERVDVYGYVGGVRTLFTTEIHCYRTM